MNKTQKIRLKSKQQNNKTFLFCVLKPFWCWYQGFKLLSHWYFASKPAEPGYMPYIVDLPHSIEYWRTRPNFAFTLISTGSFALIVKWSRCPHGLFAPPAASHAWESTHHLIIVLGMQYIHSPHHGKAPVTLSRPVVPSSADLQFPDYCRPNLSRERTRPSGDNSRLFNAQLPT